MAAAWASMLAFTVGALLPLLTIVLSGRHPDRGHRRRGAAGPGPDRLGQRSPRLQRPRKAVVRNVAGGLLAMAVTYGIGSAVGAAV